MRQLEAELTKTQDKKNQLISSTTNSASSSPTNSGSCNNNGSNQGRPPLMLFSNCSFVRISLNMRASVAVFNGDLLEKRTENSLKLYHLLARTNSPKLFILKNVTKVSKGFTVV